MALPTISRRGSCGHHRRARAASAASRYGYRSNSGSTSSDLSAIDPPNDIVADSHGLGAEIETIGVDDVDAAYDRVVDSDVRYRFVIDIDTFGDASVS